MSEDRSYDALALDRFPICHARVPSPYPPQSGGGALGVSGIQAPDRQSVPVKLLDSRQKRAGMRFRRIYSTALSSPGRLLLVAVDLGRLVTLFKGPGLLIVLDELAALIAIQAHRP